MSSNYSSDGLLRFLKEAAVAGRMHPATARSRSKAAQALVPHLEDAEAADLRTLEIEILRARLAEVQSGELRSEVADLYLERMASALTDFFRFVESPDDFEASRRVETAVSRQKSNGTLSDEERALETVRLSFNRHRADVIPIPLSRGRVVYLHGLPPDLTTAEAGKIARVVEALADPEESAE